MTLRLTLLLLCMVPSRTGILTFRAMSADIENRITLGRLLEHLKQMEKSARAAREIVQDAVAEIDVDITRRGRPVAREMIITALRAADNQGLSRAEILAAVHRDFGVEMAANTATTTLLRMQNAGLASNVVYFGF